MEQSELLSSEKQNGGDVEPNKLLQHELSQPPRERAAANSQIAPATVTLEFPPIPELENDKPISVTELPPRSRQAREAYAKAMDSTADIKYKDIFGAIGKDAKVIVDIGCGTGETIRRLAKDFPDATIIGIELNPEMRAIAKENNKENGRVKIIGIDVLTRNLTGARQVDAVILSSVVHELRSYSADGHKALEGALSNIHEFLSPGGRIIIRDPVQPDSKGNVWMKFANSEVERSFVKFAREFRIGTPEAGVPFEVFTDERSQKWYSTSAHHSNEFLLHKDYMKSSQSWQCERKEIYGSYTLSGWNETLQSRGFDIVESRKYVSPWIRENRYENQVELRSDESGRPGKPVSYPDTNMVVVAQVGKQTDAERPKLTRSQSTKSGMLDSPSVHLTVSPASGELPAASKLTRILPTEEAGVKRKSVVVDGRIKIAATTGTKSPHLLRATRPTPEIFQEHTQKSTKAGKNALPIPPGTQFARRLGVGVGLAGTLATILGLANAATADDSPAPEISPEIPSRRKTDVELVRGW